MPRHSSSTRARTRHAGRRAGDVDTWIPCLFLVAAFVLGGSSRNDVPTTPLLSLLSVAAIGVALWRLPMAGRARARPLALAALAWMGLMALQLVPLPPGLWAVLPGHAPYARALGEVGLAGRWRPASMVPDLTLASMLSILPVLAAAMLFAPRDDDGRRWLLDTLLACLGVSVCVSAVQFATQSFYLYDPTNVGLGVGLFANRNHQALFMAIGILAIAARWRLGAARGADTVPTAIAAGSAVALLPLLIITGSRAGIIVGVLALLLGGFFRPGRRLLGWRRWMVPGAAGIVLVTVTALAALSSRELALHRLFDAGEGELRLENLPAVLRATAAFFPLGSGFGTFDAVFRRFEDDRLLQPSYFNHAHNDALEIVMEGGIVAGLMALAALVAIARRGLRVVAGGQRSRSAVTARYGFFGLLLLVLGSLGDYPLRTPFLAVTGMMFCTWLWQGDDPARGPGAALGSSDVML